MGKTNAMRLLDKEKIHYNVHNYKPLKGKVDGMTVAANLGQPVEKVFKTLVTHNEENLYVFVIPVEKELDIKMAAKLVAEKKLDLLPESDLQKYTGYIRGGCSPIGMKKQYPTYIDASARDLQTMIVSAGKIGVQIELNHEDLARITRARFAPLTKEENRK